MMTACPIEDRIALNELMIAYCYAVDDLDDVEPLLALFTEDAVLDFSGIGLPLMRGKAEIRGFYEGVFADMSHHTHYLSNFRVDSHDGDAARVRAYVEGLGRAKDGAEVHVHVRYVMDCVKGEGAWKCRRYEIIAGMPIPGALEEMHGKR
jgi:ketosteroid isomerase-like protein